MQQAPSSYNPEYTAEPTQFHDDVSQPTPPYGDAIQHDGVRQSNTFVQRSDGVAHQSDGFAQQSFASSRLDRGFLPGHQGIVGGGSITEGRIGGGTGGGGNTASKRLIILVIAIILIPTLLIGAALALGIGKGDTKTPTPSPSLVPTSLPSPSAPSKHLPDETEESPSPSPSPSAKASPSPTPKTSPSPSPQPSGTTTIDLSIDELQIEDPQTGTILSSPFYAGQRVTVRAKLRNNGTSDTGVFSSSWSIKGTTMGVNTNGKVKAGATAVYDDVNSITSPIFYLNENNNAITYSVDTENVLKEANRANNTKTLTISAGATRSDLEATSVNFYLKGTNTLVATPTAGQQLTAKALIKNNGQDKQTNFSLKWYVNDSQVKETTVSSWVNPSNTLEEATGYDFTTASGTTNLKFEVNTVSAFPETNTGNNSKTVTLNL